MTKRMLIDAAHAEETRVAVVDGNRLIEFDYESKVRKQLKGSIFLAKVTRVEPSLQAAFVNFGGNRHGFLPFSEIHPDYFRIPVADREALLAEQKAMLEQLAAEEEAAIAEEEAALAAMERGEQPADPSHDDDTHAESESVEIVGGDGDSDETTLSSDETDDDDSAEDNADDTILDHSETDSDEPDSEIDGDDAGSDDGETDATGAVADDGEIIEEGGDDTGENVSANDDEQPEKVLRSWTYRSVTAFDSETGEFHTDDEAAPFAFDVETAKTVQTLVEQADTIVRVRAETQNPGEDGAEDRVVIWVALRSENEGAIEDENQTRRGRGRRGRFRGRGRGRDRGEQRGDRNEQRADRSEQRGGRGRDRGNRNGGRSNFRSKRVELVGGDGVEGDQPFRFNLRRNYKIQEVIKRGQIMLVQAQKEERGNKGAAVTTYLSLPGRYCVLMPNSPRGGGVSRKIASFAERKRMREILAELSVPEGMSVILRTAGVQRKKDEIKRDLDYLMRLWDNIRELTLQSVAPANIYEESNLVKRAVRDIFGNDIEDIQVQGEAGFKEAQSFMKMLMPSHVGKVQEYSDPKIPLFHRYQVENQIAEIGEPNVVLRSGGYLVINPTEALVSVDVNSGRATKERHIEETALKTNLEAADEVARQLRLRDLGGLVVIDFIDMEDHRNNAKVERRLKDALSSDRARIQVGRISSFGLLELSRQRLNPSLTEAQYEKCPHCKGVGSIRSVDSATILALRSLEEEGIKNRGEEVMLSIPNDIAIYMLNHKRAMLADIERRYGFKILVHIDEELAPTGYKVQSIKTAVSETSRGARFDDEEADDTSFSARNPHQSDHHGSNQSRSHHEAAEDDDQNADEDIGNRRDGVDHGAREDRATRGEGLRKRGNRAGRGRGRGRKERGEEGNEGFRPASDKNQPDLSVSLDDSDGESAAAEPTAKPAYRSRTKSDAAVETAPVEQKPAVKFQAKRFSSRKAASPDTPILTDDAQPASAEDKTEPRQKASNDTDTAAPASPQADDAGGGEKKKGWWNRLVD